MKVLFIGGTGTISSACAQLAVDRGIDLTLLNRGQTTKRSIPDGAQVLIGDIRDPTFVEAALGETLYDVIVNWIAFTPDHIETDLTLFKGRTAQYVFISSASAYHKPVRSLPITESTPLHNPYWLYSRNKVACEEKLMQAYREDNFPVTIVRPSHTYDQMSLPFQGRWTVMDRMLRGKPVIVHGDGTSLWVLTHHRDFAKAFIGMLGRSQALGEAYHITSDEVLTWNQIFEILGHAAGVYEPQLIHVPSELINAYDQGWGAGLLGDKTHSVIFDNTKIKRLVPDYVANISFRQGAEEIVTWYMQDSARRIVDEEWNQLFDKIISAQQKSFPDI
jgi:nucleoside-diphosphate-sugar epimerase